MNFFLVFIFALVHFDGSGAKTATKISKQIDLNVLMSVKRYNRIEF